MTDTPVARQSSRIAAELMPLSRPIADCHPHPDNARKHNLPLIARSLHQNGQRKPVIVQASTGNVVAGNGTWLAAAQLLGWTELAQSWQDMDDERALAYLLADNKASDASGYEAGKLEKLLARAAQGPGLLDTLWADEELEALVDAAMPVETLEAADSDAAFADPELKAKMEERKSASVRMKEVPVLLTLEDHARFVVWLKALKERYGTTGTVQTIVEAVRRQAEAEEGAEQVGRDLSAERIAEVRRALAVEVRNLISAVDDAKLTRPWLYGVLEAAAPQPRRPAPEVVPGQVGMDDMLAEFEAG